MLKFLIYVYSMLILSIYPVIKIFSLFSKSLKDQLINRKAFVCNKNKITSKRSVVFFVSSAGEYEQAKPIITRLQKTYPNIYIFIFFFSVSGIKFIQKRGESVPYGLSPLDTVWNWKKVFTAVSPQVTIVIRHELWPAFLYVASQYSRLILVDAGNNNITKKKAGFLMSFLYSFFHDIFTTSPKDIDFFKGDSEKSEIIFSGDTKYDRVLERIKEKKEEIDRLKSVFKKISKDHRWFIIGSGWHKDIDVCLNAYLKIKEKSLWKIIIAPHDISDKMINWVIKQCDIRGLTYGLFSEINESLPNIDVIIINVMGKLSEIYGCADLGFVGGALHYKIHNVLEPAAHGLNIAFGPKYHNQKEAEILAEKGLAKVIENSDELFNWWITAESNNNIIATVKELSGASDIIFNKINNYL